MPAPIGFVPPVMRRVEYASPSTRERLVVRIVAMSPVDAVATMRDGGAARRSCCARAGDLIKFFSRELCLRLLDVQADETM